MPKSKVRKKPEYTINPANRVPVKVKAGPSSMWFVSIMLGLMLIGLAWLILYYLAGDSITWLGNLGSWNFLIGFAFMIAGLLLTMRWR